MVAVGENAAEGPSAPIILKLCRIVWVAKSVPSLSTPRTNSTPPPTELRFIAGWRLNPRAAMGMTPEHVRLATEGVDASRSLLGMLVTRTPAGRALASNWVHP